jgi:hypothetical protein
MKRRLRRKIGFCAILSAVLAVNVIALVQAWSMTHFVTKQFECFDNAAHCEFLARDPQRWRRAVSSLLEHCSDRHG